MPQGVCSYIFLSHPNTKDRRQKAVFCVGRSCDDINPGAENNAEFVMRNCGRGLTRCWWEAVPAERIFLCREVYRL